MSDEQEKKGSGANGIQNGDEGNYKSTKTLLNEESLLRIAIDNRNQELNFFWQRAQFFWTLNTAALGGIGFLNATQVGEKALFTTEQITFMVSIFGLITAFSWTLTNRSSKYWYENWERKIDKNKTLRTLFEPTKSLRCWWWRWHFSPSKILIATSDVIFGFWLAISIKLGCSLGKWGIPYPPPWLVAVLILIAFTYISFGIKPVLFLVWIVKISLGCVLLHLVLFYSCLHSNFCKSCSANVRSEIDHES